MPDHALRHSDVMGNPSPDAAPTEARSVQFRNGTSIVGGGRFWKQDAAGGTAGPH